MDGGSSNLKMIEVFFFSFFLRVKVFSTKISERTVCTPSPSRFSPFPDLVINGFRELGSLRSSRNYEETTPSPTSRVTCRKRWPCTKLATYIISAPLFSPFSHHRFFEFLSIYRFSSLRFENNFEEDFQYRKGYMHQITRCCCVEQDFEENYYFFNNIVYLI